MKGGLSKRYLLLKYRDDIIVPLQHLAGSLGEARLKSRSINGINQVPAVCRSRQEKKIRTRLRIVDGRALDLKIGKGETQTGRNV